MMRSMSVPTAVSSLSLLGTFEVCKQIVQIIKLIFVPQESVLNGRLEPLGVVEVCMV